jgi:hypothetical protein
LDVAILLNITHGGWVPKDRLAEDGPIHTKYQLQEMSTDSYEARTEQNVIDSDGTLIISHGELTGGSAFTRKMAMKHGKPWFHVDLNKLPSFQAAMVIEDWVSKNVIETLNVAGPRHSKDPLIYDLVTVILELVCTLKTPKISAPEQSHDAINLKSEKIEITEHPKTVDEAVNCLISNLSLKDKSTITKMSEADLTNLHPTLGLGIRNRLLYPRNDNLLESCRQVAGDKYVHWDQAASIIIKELWEKLRETYKIRIVK